MSIRANHMLHIFYYYKIIRVKLTKTSQITISTVNSNKTNQRVISSVLTYYKISQNTNIKYHSSRILIFRKETL